MFGLEDELQDKIEALKKQIILLQDIIKKLENEPIIVSVSGGIAYCEDVRVHIIDYDNLKEEENEKNT